MDANGKRDVMDFAIPSEGSTGDKFSAAEYEGMLVMFLDHTKDTYEGDWGPTEIASCGLVVVMDHPDGPVVFEDTWVFGAALAPTINRATGPLLGVLAKGESKKGRSPWILKDANKTQTKAAASWSGKFLEQTPVGTFKYLGDAAPF